MPQPRILGYDISLSIIITCMRQYTKFLGKVGSIHSVRQILLVCKHKEDCVAQLVLIQHAV